MREALPLWKSCGGMARSSSPLVQEMNVKTRFLRSTTACENSRKKSIPSRPSIVSRYAESTADKSITETRRRCQTRWPTSSVTSRPTASPITPAPVRGARSSAGFTPAAEGRNMVWLDPVSTMRMAARLLMRALTSSEPRPAAKSNGTVNCPPFPFPALCPRDGVAKAAINPAVRTSVALRVHRGKMGTKPSVPRLSSCMRIRLAGRTPRVTSDRRPGTDGKLRFLCGS